MKSPLTQRTITSPPVRALRAPHILWMLAAAAVLAAVAMGSPTVIAQSEAEAVSGLVLSNDGPGTISISWNAPAQTPTDYRVNWAKSTDDFPSFRLNYGNVYPTDNSVKVTGLEEGVEYKVRVRARYRGDQLIEGQDKRWSTPWSDVASITTNNTATGAPTISGTAEVGQTLTADTSGIADDDGLTNASYSYQWVRNDGTTDTEISSATGAAYTLVDDDEGKTIKVKVSFTDDEDNPEALTSAATGTVAAKPNSAATGAPTITGTTEVGQTLTAATSEISDENGLENVSYSYQWIRGSRAADTELPDATDQSHVVRRSDVGKVLKVRVSFTDDLGNAESLTSEGKEILSKDDHGDTPSTATELTLDTWTNGVLQGPNDVDYFEIDITESSHLWVELVRPDRLILDQWWGGFTAWWSIRDDRGEEVRNDRGEDGMPSNGMFEPGTHYVRIHRTYQDSGPEHYYVKVFVKPDQGDTTTTAEPIKLSDPSIAQSYLNTNVARGVFSSKEDVDLFRLDLDSATRVTVNANSLWQVVTVRPNPIRAGTSVGAINVGLLDSDGNTVGTPFTGYPVQGYNYDLEAGTHYFRLSPYTDDSRNKTYLGKYTFYIVPVAEEAEWKGICERTPQVRERILSKLAVHGITDCESVTNAHLSGITGMIYLQDSGLNQLKSVDFEGLSGLQALFLKNNDLTSLEDDVFDDLVKLRVLSLASNELDELPAGVFDNLSELRALYLEHNNLSALPNGVFDGLGNLEILSLASNSLDSLEEGVLDSLSKLQELYLGSDDPPSPFTQRVASGRPVVVGTPAVGMTLTANTANIVSGNCWSGTRLTVGDSGDPNYSYQWIVTQTDGTAETEIEGATTRTYLVASGDVGKTLMVRVRYMDCGGHTEEVTSEPTGTVTADPPELSGICGRTPHIQNRILERLPETSDCEDVTAAQLSGITGTMRVNPFLPEGLSLKKADFAGLTSLRELQIHTSDLKETLPEGVFSGLTNLETLSIIGTGLTSLKDGTFEGLTNLKSLRIPWNYNLKSLEEGVFDDLVNLERLQLIGNGKLRSLPEGVFDNLINLKHLNLRGHSGTKRSTRLQALRSGVFDKLSNLEYLKLDSNSLTSLPEDIFSELDSLETLYLRDSELNTLPDGAFSGLSNLQWLYLGRNNLTSLPSDVFANATSLKRVWLHNNELESLPSDVFDDLAMLGELSLHNNNLDSLPADVFDDLTSLRKLWLNYNELDSLPDGILDNLDSLEFLELYGNDLTTIPTGLFHDLSEVKELNLSFNDLNSLPEGVFEGMSSLERLMVDSNPGSPFTLKAVLEEQDSGSVVVKMGNGAPFDMTVTLRAESGQLSVGEANGTESVNITIKAGTTTSEPIGVSLNAGQTVVTVSLHSFVVSNGEHWGIETAVGDSVELTPATTTNTPARGAPTIIGTAQVGQTLTAHTSNISDEEGLENVSYSYQWIRNDGTTDSDIDGATSETYTLVAADEGMTIKVKVSFTDDEDNPEALTSAATGTVAAKPNSAATGAPTIRGTAEVGQTLSADTSDIRDDDGLVGVLFSYQWLADDADISGATENTYLLTTSEMGKAIKVRVSFTDEGGNDEVLTSAATGAVSPAIQQQRAPNTPAAGAPSIRGTAQVGQTLTAVTSDISDEDGLENVSYSYQWIRNDGTTDSDINGETSPTYTLVAADEGKTIKVKVSFTDDEDNPEALTSAATSTVAAKPNTAAAGSPTIRGTAQVGQTLTADTSNVSDEDGLENVSYSYQWVRNDGTTDSDIDGETSPTYTLVAADEGKTIKVKVSFTDDEDNDEVLTSAATETVTAKPNTDATGAPTIDGTPEVGQTLTADTSDIADEDGLENVSYSYQWVRNDGTIDSEIDGATSPTYTLVAADKGMTIKVKVTFTDDEDNPEALTSAATSTVAAKPNTAAAGSPTVRGMVQVGETLTADTSDISDEDGLTDVTYSYQWIRNDGTEDADITDATAVTYSLVDDDEGKTIKVKVSFTDDADNDEILTSAATETVAAKPNTAAAGSPAIRGTAQVGQTLTADTSGISDDDGLTGVSYGYQWVRNDGTEDTDISGATNSTYTLVSEDEGKTIKVEVSFTDDADNDETLTSAATATVAAKPNSEDGTREDATWAATMTAGLLLYGHYGYSGFEGAPGGSLTTDEFAINGVTYTVLGMGASGWMYITFDKEIPKAFTIEVDGTRLDSTDASFTSYSYGKTYEWQRTGIHWSDGDEVELKLYLSG